MLSSFHTNKLMNKAQPPHCFCRGLDEDFEIIAKTDRFRVGSDRVNLHYLVKENCHISYHKIYLHIYLFIYFGAL